MVHIANILNVLLHLHAPLGTRERRRGWACSPQQPGTQEVRCICDVSRVLYDISSGKEVSYLQKGRRKTASTLWKEPDSPVHLPAESPQLSDWMKEMSYLGKTDRLLENYSVNTFIVHANANSVSILSLKKPNIVHSARNTDADKHVPVIATLVLWSYILLYFN